MEHLAAAVTAADTEWNARTYTPTECVDLLWQIQDAIGGLRALDDDIRKQLLANAEDREIVTDRGTIEVLRKTKRTQWRVDELVADAVARLVDDRTILFDDAGERRPWPAAAHLLVGRLREVVSVPGGKVTGMRLLGMQPDEYCQETPDGWAVRLPPRP